MTSDSGLFYVNKVCNLLGLSTTLLNPEYYDFILLLRNQGYPIRAAARHMWKCLQPYRTDIPF